VRPIEFQDAEQVQGIEMVGLVVHDLPAERPGFTVLAALIGGDGGREQAFGLLS
jgi:hypothetical protein